VARPVTVEILLLANVSAFSGWITGLSNALEAVGTSRNSGATTVTWVTIDMADSNRIGVVLVRTSGAVHASTDCRATGFTRPTKWFAAALNGPN